MTYLLFLLGFGLLILGADWLVKGASSMARKLSISELVIGLTIVAFGTSTPELVVSVTASIRQAPELAIANVVGSNIFNIFIIIGIAAMIRPVPVLASTVWKEIPFSLLSAIILLVLSLDLVLDGQGPNTLGRTDGLVLLAFFLIFLVYSFDLARKGEIQPDHDVPAQVFPVWKSVLFFMGGLGLLVLGGRWVVNGASAIGLLLGMSQAMIGLTIVAAGTSLPELVTSAMAAYRNKPEIAIGNAIGSNIYNIFFILGTSATIHPLPYDTAQMSDTLVMMAAYILLFLLVILGRHFRTVTRWEGAAMVAAYIGFITVSAILR
ncbi:MAG TPA: calcium/sodium antiporter [Bacteroidales bacterium]|nr:calcium/sodium antiporter [Bacteroidales bacterium]HRZ76803.1 calcium/sodium antiporter [Bacteroidales bacterium]